MPQPGRRASLTNTETPRFIHFAPSYLRTHGVGSNCAFPSPPSPASPYIHNIHTEREGCGCAHGSRKNPSGPCAQSRSCATKHSLPPSAKHISPARLPVAMVPYIHSTGYVYNMYLSLYIHPRANDTWRIPFADVSCNTDQPICPALRRAARTG